MSATTGLLGAEEHKEGGATTNAERELEQERQIMAGTDTTTGLTTSQWKQRLAEWGPNMLPEKEENLCLKFMCKLLQSWCKMGLALCVFG